MIVADLFDARSQLPHFGLSDPSMPLLATVDTKEVVPAPAFTLNLVQRRPVHNRVPNYDNIRFTADSLEILNLERNKFIVRLQYGKCVPGDQNVLQELECNTLSS